MKKLIYLILIGSPISLITKAQEIVTSSGGSITNNSIQVNWTIGEPMTETVSSSTKSVTSGLNQPTLKIETVIVNIKSKTPVSIYPNPTSQFVTIQFEEQVHMKAQILTLNGTVVSTIEITEQSTKIDFSGNKSGVYIIDLIDKAGSKNTYRIIKQ